MIDLSGKVTVVTGGAQGIGLGPVEGVDPAAGEDEVGWGWALGAGQSARRHEEGQAQVREARWGRREPLCTIGHG